MNRRKNQIDILDEVDEFTIRQEKAEKDRIIRKLAEGYEEIKLDNYRTDKPEGLVVILSQDLFRNEHMTTHFYRTVLGYHRAVRGMMMHLVADPDEEWPDVVPWAGVAGRPDYKKWVYPHYVFRYWTKGEIVEPIPID